MSTADIVIDLHFLQYGKTAPSNSSFQGVMSGNSLFGGYFEYTGRSSATGAVKNKDETISLTNEPGSFLGYTSREAAVQKSMAGNKPYYTMTNDGKLTNENEREVFSKKWMNSFSKDGDLAWTMVMSFKDKETLDKYGIQDQEDFARITNIALHSAFLKIHMEPENMIWWEDYHTNTKHPHIHVTFLEKEHTRDRGKLTTQEVRLIKETFYSKIAAQRVFEQDFGATPDEVLKSLQPQRKKIVSLTQTMPYRTIDKVVNLYTQLPSTGRLQYNAMNMDPFRKQLDDIIGDLLKSDIVKPEMNDYENKLQRLSDEIGSMGNEEVSNLRQSQMKKLYSQIGNAILDEFKTGLFEDDHRISALKSWKEDTGNEILRNNLEEIKAEEHTSEPIKKVITAMQDGQLDSAYELADELPDGEEAEFVKGTLQVIFPRNEEDRLMGINKISEASEQNYQPARHFMNFMRKSFGMNKPIYHTLKAVFPKHIKKPSVSAVQNCREEVEEEIDLCIRAAIEAEEMMREQRQSLAIEKGYSRSLW